MAGTNVGNLNVKLTLSAQQFAAALVAAGGNVNQFAMQVQTAQTSVQRIAPAAQTAARGASVLTTAMGALGGISGQAAYGLSDMISQLGTRGLGGGLQAAANNIQVMGAAFGPWGLAVSSGIAIATQGIGIYLEQTERAKKKTEQATKAVQDYSHELEYLGHVQALRNTRETGRIERQFARADMRTMSSDALSSRLQSAKREATILSSDVGTIQKQQLDILRPTFKRLFGDIATPEFLGLDVQMGMGRRELRHLFSRFPQVMEGLGEQRLKELTQLGREQEKLIERRREAGESVYDTEKALRAAQEREAQIKQDSYDTSRAERANRPTAPSIGAVDATSAEGFSIIQAAIRGSRDAKDPQLEAIGGSTKKTAENTKEIANRIKRLKVATIA